MLRRALCHRAVMNGSANEVIYLVSGVLTDLFLMFVIGECDL